MEVEEGMVFKVSKVFFSILSLRPNYGEKFSFLSLYFLILVFEGKKDRRKNIPVTGTSVQLFGEVDNLR